MKQVLVQQGNVRVEEVPAPQVEAGTVLIEVFYSCISAGTEISGVKGSAAPLWKKILRKPQAVEKGLTMLAEHGFKKTWHLVQDKNKETRTTGYSVAGRVLEVGSGIDDLFPGDWVAAAGAQCAHHAEIVRVPRNLVAPMPEGLDVKWASTVTLGAIALQGVRRAQPTLGETFVVLGLGLLGQLTVQMLKSNGCRVIGIDLDRARLQKALDYGMDVALHPQDGDQPENVAQLTDGVGADGVIITAASPSDEIVSTAFRLTRKKGRVVLVGDVGLHLNRADFYEKEIDFLISTSYGPGRYDRNYEEKGLDYPTGYVRWTENRNMGEYLRLLSDGKIRLDAFLDQPFAVDDVSKAFALLAGGEAAKPVLMLLKYAHGEAKPVNLSRTLVRSDVASVPGERVRLAVVGLGGFAKGVHLPNLKALSHMFHLETVCSRSGHNAADIAQRYHARIATTDFPAVIADPNIDAVLIATRHDLHADLTLQALKAGKHVFVEKPLAVTQSELDALREFYSTMSDAKRKALLMTGFNRRFSPHAVAIREKLRNRRHPIILNYKMNAGFLPPNHWVFGAEGGGRNIGEACHIYDLFTYLIDGRFTDVTVQSLAPRSYYSPRDNFVVTIKFDDGSLATLTYTALGNPAYPKETLEVFTDGQVMVLDDYKTLRFFGAKNSEMTLRFQDKGHREGLAAFGKALKTGAGAASDWPIPFWQQDQATQIALLVEGKL